MSHPSLARKVYHIELDQGLENTFVFRKVDEFDQPVDLSGYSARMQVREGMNGIYSSYDIPYTVIDAGTDNTEEDSNIRLTEDGYIVVTIQGQDTAPLQWNRAVYDIVLTDSTGAKSLFVSGFVTVRSRSTVI